MKRSFASAPEVEAFCSIPGNGCELVQHVSTTGPFLHPPAPAGFSKDEVCPSPSCATSIRAMPPLSLPGAVSDNTFRTGKTLLECGVNLRTSSFQPNMNVNLTQQEQDAECKSILNDASSYYDVHTRHCVGASYDTDHVLSVSTVEDAALFLAAEHPHASIEPGSCGRRDRMGVDFDPSSRSRILNVRTQFPATGAFSPAPVEEAQLQQYLVSQTISDAVFATRLVYDEDAYWPHYVNALSSDAKKALKANCKSPPSANCASRFVEGTCPSTRCNPAERCGPLMGDSECTVNDAKLMEDCPHTFRICPGQEASYEQMVQARNQKRREDADSTTKPPNWQTAYDEPRPSWMEQRLGR